MASVKMTTALKPGVRRNPHRACLFLYQRHVAELPVRGRARIFGCHAAIDVVLRFALDVIADVVVEILKAAASRHLSTRT
jgi:hypothetical protein